LWRPLYRVLDAIEEDMGGEKALESMLKERKWVDGSELKRFTHTANNYQAIGDLARHGRGDWQPPDNPMTLGDAEQQISTLLKSWLEYRQQNP